MGAPNLAVRLLRGMRKHAFGLSVLLIVLFASHQKAHAVASAGAGFQTPTISLLGACTQLSPTLFLSAILTVADTNDGLGVDHFAYYLVDGDDTVLGVEQTFSTFGVVSIAGTGILSTNATPDSGPFRLVLYDDTDSSIDFSVGAQASFLGGLVRAELSFDASLLDVNCPGSAQQADLSVSISGDLELVPVGGTLTLSATISNAGPSIATNAVATVTLPAGLTLVSTSGCDNDPGGVPTCTLGDIASGAFETVDIQATVDVGAIGTLTASVAVTSDVDDPNLTNNTGSDDTDIDVPLADLSVSISGDAELVPVGGTLTLSATVTNAGPDTATNVVATVTLPSGFTLAATSGCDNDPGGAPTCTLGDIASGVFETVDIQVTVDVGASGTLTATVAVTSDVADPNLTDNTGSDDTDIGTPSADLSVSISGDAELVPVGGTLTLTATVTNAGTSTATNVVATVTLPSGFTLAATSGCDNDPGGAPTCTLGDIASGAFETVDVQVTVDVGASGTLTATVAVTSDVADPNLTDNTGSEDTDIGTPSADLSVSISGDAELVPVGGTLTLTAIVSNSGPSTATNVVATVTLPSGLTLAATSGCDNDPGGAPTCTLGDIASGAFETVDIQVTVDVGASGTLTATVAVTSDVADPNLTDNTGSDDTDIGTPSADLSVSISSDSELVPVGGTVTLSAMVSNSGPSTATNVIATVTLPAGLSLVATSGCDNDPGGAPTCTMGDVAPGASETVNIQITVDVGASGTLTAAVAVTSDIADLTPGDSSANIDIDIGTPSADLSVSISGDAEMVPVGGTLTLTATVSNAGPSIATNVIATVTLPSGLTLVSTSGCDNDPVGAPTCLLGDIASGAFETAYFQATVDVGASGTLSASIAVTSDVADPTPGDSAGSDDTEIGTPLPGSITLAVQTAPAPAGNDRFTFSSALAAFNGLSLITAGNTAVSTAVTPGPGSYLVTQGATDDWEVNSISCSGDTDGGSAIDVASGSVTIDLDAGEAIVCTFVNARDATALVSVTKQVISSFVEARAEQLASQKPDLTSRMDAQGIERRIGSPLNVTATGTELRHSITFSTSAREILAEAQRLNSADPQELAAVSAYLPGDNTAILRGPQDAEPKNDHGLRLDVWTEGRYSHVETNIGSSDFFALYLGAEVGLGNSLLLGVMAQTDWSDTRNDAAGSTVNGFGWMVGPYAVARVHENLMVYGRFAWGRSVNDINPIGQYEDTFKTERLLIEGRATGVFNYGDWRFRPAAELLYFTENQLAYVDSLGNPIPSQRVELGRLAFGPELKRRFVATDGIVVIPKVLLHGVWNFMNTSSNTSDADLRANVEVGLQLETLEGWRINLAAGYDGIGSEDLDAYSAKVRLHIPIR